ncbi:hypothetical protein [Paraburkholderia dinghuensis]|uniref:hypothetical protein n=1 Tax=Paraburkholderia dinghuensis TaxID=2305225 RepID=UPI00162A4B37|nr:hypothetical protein [Paraburkholderia dinghuensis]
MKFSLLLPHQPHLTQTPQPLHPDADGARLRAEVSPTRSQPTFAARWRDLRARVFRI